MPRGDYKPSCGSAQGGVSRLVKQAGADTTLKNAIRDGAEWAWVPHGDTCPFCITLASNGWQPASKKALKGDHAQHIHAHCDCEYAIRFDSSTTVAGYDPDKGYYLLLYHGIGDDGAARTILYSQLQGQTPLAIGTMVQAGQVLGAVGNSGMSTGPHLHLELWRDGTAVDPAGEIPC